MMAMDQGILWFAPILLLSAVAVWLLAAGARVNARGYLRLAAVMEAALAAGEGLRIAPTAVAPLACTLAVVLLAFAVHASFRRPAKPGVAALILTATLLSAVGAAYSGEVLPAVAPQVVGVAAILAIARRGLMRLRGPSIQLTAGGVALFAASCALVSTDADAPSALLLFSAAGHLGIALAVVRISDTFVKRRRPPRIVGAISRQR
jgi:hypothetical protein